MKSLYDIKLEDVVSIYEKVLSETIEPYVEEAIDVKFFSKDVDFLAIRDSTYIKDDLFKVFAKKDVLDILTKKLFPAVSKAGRVPSDFNVDEECIFAGIKVFSSIIDSYFKL